MRMQLWSFLCVGLLIFNAFDLLRTTEQTLRRNNPAYTVESQVKYSRFTGLLSLIVGIIVLIADILSVLKVLGEDLSMLSLVTLSVLAVFLIAIIAGRFVILKKAGTSASRDEEF